MEHKTKMIGGVLAGLVSFGGLLTDCASLPGATPDASNSCSFPTTAVYAAGGATLGAATGAAVSNGTGWGTGLGGLFGAGVGALIGNDVDQQCRQQALQKAMQQAEAYQAVPQGQARQAGASASASTTIKKRHKPARSVEPNFEPVVWSSSNGSSGSITPLTPISVDPVTSQNCSTVDNKITKNGQTSDTTQTVCKQENGTWKVVASQ
jgi:surface antigen